MICSEIHEWNKDRVTALRSLDVEKMKAFLKKYDSTAKIPSDAVLEITMRKTLFNTFGVSIEEREAAARWLKERGYNTSCDEVIKGVR